MAIHGGKRSDIINGMDGVTDLADEIYGHEGNDIIYGLGGPDRIYGGDGDDDLFGQSGDDFLQGGEGADDLFGGSGLGDEASYADSPVGVTVSLPSEMGVGRGYHGTAEGDTLTDIERLTGSGYDDWLTGNGADNILRGLGGDDLLKGGGGTDRLEGGDNNDRLEGGAGGDTLLGGAGNDTATYSFSPVGVFVSLANGWATGGHADDDTLDSIENLLGSAYADTLWGESGRNVLNGNPGNDSLKGLGGDDTLRGGNGEDYLDGGSGADEMIGQEDNDTYIVDNALDTVSEFGMGGNDTVRTSVSWTITGTADIERLETTEETGTWAVNLTGNVNGNEIVGNDGNNTIAGGDGNDQLTGHLGQDIFLFNTDLNAASNMDHIFDFTAVDDTIQLDNDIFSADLALGSVAGSQFVIGTAALDRGDRIIYDDMSGNVYYDSDGTDPTPQILFARLNPGLLLENFDFFVIAD